VVATDVGACRDIMSGMDKEDMALGPSGIITPVNAPEETARGLERYATDPELLYRHGQAGRERARRYYDLRRIMAQYQELYETYMYACGGVGSEGGAAGPA
jgi:glycosyltransferase involved in cell wall biosynthesis